MSERFFKNKWDYGDKTYSLREAAQRAVEPPGLDDGRLEHLQREVEFLQQTVAAILCGATVEEILATAGFEEIK